LVALPLRPSGPPCESTLSDTSTRTATSAAPNLKDTEVPRMSKSAIKPVGSHVIVQRSSASEKSVGGIVLPKKAKDKPTEGKVIAVGNGSRRL